MNNNMFRVFLFEKGTKDYVQKLNKWRKKNKK